MMDASGKKKMGYSRTFDADSSRPLKQRDVERATYSIWNEHSDRLTRKTSPGDGSDTKNESAKNFLRREVYALGRRLLRSKSGQELVAKLFSQLGFRTTRPQAMENVFHGLLCCIYEGEGGFTRQERSLIAKELEYAHRHNVPPELLCGFLYQSTDRRRLSARLVEGFIEPAFRRRTDGGEDA
ncbi:hypothetical protein [Aurantiacibacter arachoides]|uniref:hypothetical protein n=1 Tax=Aurantiacibacter arachoides TaxID=1850444 RepID=UPI001F364B23|nr:hypothetical protein [Aurantiacibacter arachoides]